MEWAEEFGIGEMGLTAREFWRLTVHEFWIKHRAFMRDEDRRRALLHELALLTVSYDKGSKARGAVENAVKALRRYPLKQWLLRGR